VCACVYTGLSDPFVEILLMPEARFKIEPVKTDCKKKELDPFYAKDFKMYIYVCCTLLVCGCILKILYIAKYTDFSINLCVLFSY